MIEIKHLTKVYKLNKKQMAESKTKNPLKTAVDDLSLKAEEGGDLWASGSQRRGKDYDSQVYCHIDKAYQGRDLCE